jgi:hypothetical protein
MNYFRSPPLLDLSTGSADGFEEFVPHQKKGGAGGEAWWVGDELPQHALQSTKMADNSEHKVLAARTLRPGETLRQSVQQGVDPFALIEPTGNQPGG